MATFGSLYREAQAMHDELVAQQNREPPSSQLMRKIEALKRIMELLKSAYLQAGGSQAPKTGQ